MKSSMNIVAAEPISMAFILNSSPKVAKQRLEKAYVSFVARQQIFKHVPAATDMCILEKLLNAYVCVSGYLPVVASYQLGNTESLMASLSVMFVSCQRQAGYRFFPQPLDIEKHSISPVCADG